ncbi:hypothetical protein VNO80_01204 [Phaseolus coccineus]|uniref:Uncharacterized protein n=1 Tax=Phaseolus coccineus TaxID=3886 RepID=A0AAN9RSI8_PHACN
MLVAIGGSSYCLKQFWRWKIGAIEDAGVVLAGAAHWKAIMTSFLAVGVSHDPYPAPNNRVDLLEADVDVQPTSTKLLSNTQAPQARAKLVLEKRLTARPRQYDGYVEEERLDCQSQNAKGGGGAIIPVNGCRNIRVSNRSKCIVGPPLTAIERFLWAQQSHSTQQQLQNVANKIHASALDGFGGSSYNIVWHNGARVC